MNRDLNNDVRTIVLNLNLNVMRVALHMTSMQVTLFKPTSPGQEASVKVSLFNKVTFIEAMSVRADTLFTLHCTALCPAPLHFWSAFFPFFWIFLSNCIDISLQVALADACDSGQFTESGQCCSLCPAGFGVEVECGKEDTKCTPCPKGE